MINVIYRDTIIEGQVFDKVKYSGESVWRSKFNKCTWNKCKFEKFSFANGTVIEECVFNECKFLGQYMYFGGPAIYRNVKFTNCTIKNANFWKTELHNVTISGSIENVVFYGDQVDVSLRTVATNLVLSDAKLIDCDFRKGFLKPQGFA